jgi:phage shock protein PspC (stress-responsive transcriptional regulator)
VDVAAAPAPPDDPGLPPPGPPADSPPADRIVGGVGGLLASRLGLDSLWVRLGFVLLVLVSGLGLVLYGGLWLALVVGARPGRAWARYLGGAVLLILVPLIIGTADLRLAAGPMAVIVLLLGLTVALWRPRSAAPASPAAAATFAEHSIALGREMPPGWADRASAPLTRARPVREPSVLGRTTLGAAVVVAAAGALIDQANGGRLHPEQWLGAATAVCGLGLLVGSFRGRAHWLVLPAAAFAGSGVVAGVAAAAGIGAGDLTGDRWIGVFENTTQGPHVEEVAFGFVQVDVAAAPATPARVVARVGMGGVRVHAAANVTVEIRSNLDHGDLRVGGVVQPSDAVTVGPDGPPDLIVEAHIERGSVEVDQSDPPRPELPQLPQLPQLPDPPEPLLEDVPGTSERLEPVSGNVAGTADGWIVLGRGEAVIDPDDRIVTGEAVVLADSTTVIPTSEGEYRLLPRSILIGPSGEVLDLVALREALAAPAATTSSPSGG